MLSSSASKRLRMLQFPLITGVLFIHSSDTTIGLFEKSIGTDHLHGSVDFIINMISNGVARTAVPLFFLMAGYFFSPNFDGRWRTYTSKLQARVWSLLVPYLLWSLFTIAVFAFAQSWPWAAGFFSGKRQPVITFTGMELFNAIVGRGRPPISYQLWFLRDLMLLVVCSPVLYHALRLRAIALPALGLLLVMWLLDIRLLPVVANEAVLFFALGMYIYVERFSLFAGDRYIKQTLAVYACLLVANAWPLTAAPNPIFQRLTIAVGIVAVLSATALIVERGFLERLLLRLSAASFFVYVAHEPLLTILRKVAYVLIEPSSSSTILFIYVAAPTVTALMLIRLNDWLSTATPRFHALITGGRKESVAEAAHP